MSRRYHDHEIYLEALREAFDAEALRQYKRYERFDPQHLMDTSNLEAKQGLDPKFVAEATERRRKTADWLAAKRKDMLAFYGDADPEFRRAWLSLRHAQERWANMIRNSGKVEGAKFAVCQILDATCHVLETGTEREAAISLKVPRKWASRYLRDHPEPLSVVSRNEGAKRVKASVLASIICPNGLAEMLKCDEVAIMSWFRIIAFHLVEVSRIFYLEEHIAYATASETLRRNAARLQTEFQNKGPEVCAESIVRCLFKAAMMVNGTPESEAATASEGLFESIESGGVNARAKRGKSYARKK